MASVFLSYDHEDGALAKPLVLALEKAGHTVWFDRHIHGGAQYSRKIEQALGEADAVVVLWSARSLESAWVRDEAGAEDIGAFGFAIQALAEFDQTELLVERVAQTPSDVVGASTYLLFRPAFSDYRRDPRFMAMARRVGLADYWLSTGKWPDFCKDRELPYDCKTEAAKRG